VIIRALLLIYVGALAPAAALQAIESEVVSTRYEVCAYPGQCKTIDLRSDGTFTYTYHLDGVVWPPVEGRWRSLDDGLMLANTVEQPSPAPLELQSRPRLAGLSFCVADDISGVAIPEAWISVDADGISSSVNTDAAGCITLPRYRNVRNLRVTHCEYEAAEYSPSNPTANVFRIRLRRPRPLVTNQYWLAQNGQLLILAEPPLDSPSPAAP